MGIDGFHNFLKKKAPGVYKQVHLSSYQGKAIAVDISGLIYKFKVLNKERWLDNFAYLIFALRRNQIHPIFVYDGEAPPEKDQEKSKRAQSRKKIIDKVSSFREELDHYYQTGEIKSILQEENKKLKNIPSLVETKINTGALEKRYIQLESQIVHFQEEELNELNELFDLCGIQYVISPGEAETLCASLALEGKVSAVISNDSDVVAYGVQKFLYDINWMTETCLELDHSEICKALEFTEEQILDFCIMCGNDYNSNLPGIGPVNAYRLIKEHQKIENLPKNIDVTILNFKRSRELFHTHYDFEDEVISKIPESLIKIFNFLTLKNSRIRMEVIEKAFKKIEIVFDD
jgi:5'-3' exonuclease